jgi:hypothetical protein
MRDLRRNDAGLDGRCAWPAARTHRCDHRGNHGCGGRQMKIISRVDFLSLPKGTLFTFYTPCYFEGLCVKQCDPGEWGVDFLYDDLIAPIDVDDPCATLSKLSVGDQVPVTYDEITTRDGAFEENQLFAVYSTDEIQRLILKLGDCLA